MIRISSSRSLSKQQTIEDQRTRSCEYFRLTMFTRRVRHTDYSYPRKQTAQRRVHLQIWFTEEPPQQEWN